MGFITIEDDDDDRIIWRTRCPLRQEQHPSESESSSLAARMQCQINLTKHFLHLEWLRNCLLVCTFTYTTLKLCQGKIKVNLCESDRIFDFCKFEWAVFAMPWPCPDTPRYYSPRFGGIQREILWHLVRLQNKFIYVSQLVYCRFFLIPRNLGGQTPRAVGCARIVESSVWSFLVTSFFELFQWPNI